MSARETARELAQEIASQSAGYADLIAEQNATRSRAAAVPVAWDDLLDHAKSLHRAKRLNGTPGEQLLYLHQLACTTDLITTWTARAAREAGETWQSIGDSLHITKQAAQQRFGKP